MHHLWWNSEWYFKRQASNINSKNKSKTNIKANLRQIQKQIQKHIWKWLWKQIWRQTKFNKHWGIPAKIFKHKFKSKSESKFKSKFNHVLKQHWSKAWSEFEDKLIRKQFPNLSFRIPTSKCHFSILNDQFKKYLIRSPRPWWQNTMGNLASSTRGGTPGGGGGGRTHILKFWLEPRKAKPCFGNANCFGSFTHYPFKV